MTPKTKYRILLLFCVFSTLFTTDVYANLPTDTTSSSPLFVLETNSYRVLFFSGSFSYQPTKNPQHQVKVQLQNTNAQPLIELQNQITNATKGGFYAIANETVQSTGFNQLIYKDIYPGIDLVFSLPQQNEITAGEPAITYQFIARKDANPRNIHLTYDGFSNFSFTEFQNIFQIGNTRIEEDFSQNEHRTSTEWQKTVTVRFSSAVSSNSTGHTNHRNTPPTIGLSHFSASQIAFSIQPNPASSVLSVHFKTNGQKTILVTDLYGKTIFSEQTANPFLQLNVSKLPRGLYLMTVHNNQNFSSQKLLLF